MITRINIYSEYQLFALSIKCLLSETLQDSTDIYTIGYLDSDYFSKNQICVLNLVSKTPNETVEIIENIMQSNKDANLIILGTACSVKHIKSLFALGVKAFLCKDTSNGEFAEAVNEVKKGKTYLNSSIKETMLDLLLKINNQAENTVQVSHLLTEREQEVLRIIAEGKSSKEISNQLFISIHTVDTHRRNIMQKLNLNSSCKLMKYIYDHNLFQSA